MADVDEMFELKNAFYTGNYQQCINEAPKTKASSEGSRILRDVYMYRSYIAQKKYGVVLDEIRSSASPALLAVKSFAEYLSNESSRARIISELDKKISGSLDLNNVPFLISAANIYYMEGNNETALKILHQADDLECMALRIQILLKMDQVEMAQREYNKMHEKDEDSTISQLAQAWVYLALGGTKLKEAYYIFQDLADKYNITSLLLNGQAASYIAQGKFDDAETVLQEAMDKDSNNPETLVNMIVLSQHMGKPAEVVNRYVSQLKDSHRRHMFIEQYNNKESEFEKLARGYQPSVTS